MTRLTPPARLRNFALVIRCIHQRGEDQEACLQELNARGLWLSSDQKAQAGLLEPIVGVSLFGGPSTKSHQILHRPK